MRTARHAALIFAVVAVAAASCTHSSSSSDGERRIEQILNQPPMLPPDQELSEQEVEHVLAAILGASFPKPPGTIESVLPERVRPRFQQIQLYMNRVRDSDGRYQQEEAAVICSPQEVSDHLVGTRRIGPESPTERDPERERQWLMEQSRYSTRGSR